MFKQTALLTASAAALITARPVNAPTPPRRKTRLISVIVIDPANLG